METYYQPALDEMNSGPELPPMEPGLPNTETIACRELLLAVVVRGLLVGMSQGETSFVMGPQFVKYCLYIGLSPEATAKIQYLFYTGKLKGRAHELEVVMRGQGYIRNPDMDPELAPAAWQSWKSPAL